jgi:hypothetical protein
VGRPPVGLQVLGDVLAGLLQLVLVQDHVEHIRGTLLELLGSHHLDVEVARLRLASRLDEPLQYLHVHDSKARGHKSNFYAHQSFITPNKLKQFLKFKQIKFSEKLNILAKNLQKF